MTPEEHQRRVQRRLRRELVAEGLDPAELDRLPEGVVAFGDIVDDLLEDVAEGRDPRERAE